jgi:quaternary ammonium compound-resistance protein SugE
MPMPGARFMNNQRSFPTMAWVLLTIAGILEIAFALCMKSSEGFTRLLPSAFTVASGLSSVVLLSFSLRTLPVGTGYAVWTGIGAAGTAILGMAILGDSVAPLRILCIVLILAGVIGLKLVSGS